MPDENKKEEETTEEETKNTNEKVSPKKSASGLEQNVAALLSYLFGIIGGIIFYVIEKDNKFVRFHAMQSILLSIASGVLLFALMPLMMGFILTGLGFLAFLLPLINIAIFALWIVLMIKAYNNEEWEVPIIGKIARNMIEKS